MDCAIAGRHPPDPTARGPKSPTDRTASMCVAVAGAPPHDDERHKAKASSVISAPPFLVRVSGIQDRALLGSSLSRPPAMQPTRVAARAHTCRHGRPPPHVDAFPSLLPTSHMRHQTARLCSTLVMPSPVAAQRGCAVRWAPAFRRRALWASCILFALGTIWGLGAWSASAPQTGDAL